VVSVSADGWTSTPVRGGVVEVRAMDGRAYRFASAGPIVSPPPESGIGADYRAVAQITVGSARLCGYLIAPSVVVTVGEQDVINFASVAYVRVDGREYVGRPKFIDFKIATAVLDLDGPILGVVPFNLDQTPGEQPGQLVQVLSPDGAVLEGKVTGIEFVEGTRRLVVETSLPAQLAMAGTPILSNGLIIGHIEARRENTLRVVPSSLVLTAVNKADAVLPREPDDQDAWAIVIGVSRYSDPNLPLILDAERTASKFASWLTSFRRLPRSQVALLLSPSLSEISEQFERLAVASGHPFGRQLFVYFSGHVRRSQDSSFVLAADSRPDNLMAIDLRRWVSALFDRGIFQEAVIFIVGGSDEIDPPSDSPYPYHTREPTWAVMQSAANPLRLLMIECRESTSFTSSPNTPSFDEILLEGLSGGVGDANGNVTSDEFGRFMMERTKELGLSQVVSYQMIDKPFVLVPADRISNQPPDSPPQTDTEDQVRHERAKAVIETIFPAEALTLVATSYRGCEFNLSNAHSRKIVYDEIVRCLNAFSATRGKWELTWGPAGYRPGITGTDISAMYAVRSIGETSASNLAIVIRGTNFFSPLDWLSNLLIDTRPWEYGGATSDVKISHSTWLGLRILHRLQSGPVPAPPAEQTPVEQVQAAETAAEAAVAYDFLKKVIQGSAPFDIATYLTQIREQITAIARGSSSLGHDQGLQQAILDAQQPPATGGTLLEFLKNFVANTAAPVNIHVIGHSKSGALAPALALWLADTQGGAVADSARWDPGSKANLHVYSFSAPTPGNAGFAARFNRRIASAYRLENTYDIVPHVWNPNEVREIPDLYGDQLTSLRIPADALALTLQLPAYQHEVPSMPWTGAAVPQSNFLQRAGVEHLDSYLKEFGLYDADTLSILALFAPIA
jgi:hypothetical protein